MHQLFCRFAACLFFLWFFSGALPATAQLRIFNASPSALPHEAITLQGHFSPTAKVYLSRGTDGTVLTPAVLVQGDGQATVAIPANLALDLYQVWVAEGSVRSPSVFINRAWGMHYNSPDVVPGGSVRIFGRNLQLSGSTPRVRFVQQDNAASTPAAVVAAGSDAFKLGVSVPGTLLPGKTYDVYVTNGFGAALGETKVEQPLRVIPATANYFNLPVDWGHRFDYYTNRYNVKTDPRLAKKAVGDGVADDQAAIQQGIAAAAQAGGGVVYLPAGSYKLLARGLELPSRVMLVGAGINQTFLRYGYAGDGLGIRVSTNATTSGLADLSVENVSDDGTWKSNLLGDQVTEFVLQRVRLKLNKGWWLDLANANKLSITNCEITQGVTSTTGYRGPVRFDGSKNIVFANNTVTYAVDALNFGYTARGGANNIVFEHNTINRDGSARWPVAAGLINHVAAFNFTWNVANLNNTYQVINGDPQNINDGETIVAEQGAGYTPDKAVGTVTGATATTLTDNTKAWGALVQAGVGVSIVHGKGMGQWRPITSRTATTLTLGEAWEVVPDATSRYSIYTWGARNWLVQGNTMQGNQRGITIYHNATKDVAIADNVLVNNGSIDITPLQQDNSTGTTTVGLLPVYNVQVVNNRVSDVNGKMGVFIGVHPVQHLQTRTFGTAVIGFEVRNNNVTAHTPNVVARVDDNYPNGYLNYLEYHTLGQNYVDEGIPAIVGSIFQDNTATNCDNALYLNSASYNTLVCEMKLVNATSQLKDSKLLGVAHAAVRTASCASNPTGLGTPLPVADPKTDKP